MVSLDGVKAILLDVEGTTTPISFVHDVLFPFAAERIEAVVNASSPSEELQRDLDSLMREYDADPDRDGVPREPGPYLLHLIAHDRKSTALKSIQGRIWKEGYESGELKGAVYDDVRPAIERWTKEGLRIGIFSSGSVLAQKLLFGHSTQGDLTPYLSGHWDTKTGAKKEAASYSAIARDWGFAPGEVLFVSDVEAELDAAKAAEMKTLRSQRPGIAALDGDAHASVTSFDEV